MHHPELLCKDNGTWQQVEEHVEDVTILLGLSEAAKVLVHTRGHNY